MPETDVFCSMCGLEMGRQKFVKDREGDVYCQPCFAARRKVQERQRAKQAAESPGAAGGVPVAGAALLTPQVVQEIPEPAPAPAPKMKPVEIAAALKPAWGVLGASVIIMTALHMFVTDGEHVGFGQALGAGIIHTIFMLLGSVVLIASLAITLAITGGSNSGTLISLIAKAMGLMLAVTILDFFSGMNESFWLMLILFRGILMVTALIVLFKLDFLETMVLSLINMALGWVLTFALAAALLTFASIGHHAGGDHEMMDDEEEPTQQAMPTERELDLELDR